MRTFISGESLRTEEEFSESFARLVKVKVVVVDETTEGERIDRVKKVSQGRALGYINTFKIRRGR